MDMSVSDVYSGGYSTWNGYRVWAVDGSKMQLPSDPAPLEQFGATGRGHSAVTAQSSCLYDVLNDIIADARLEPIKTDERALAVMHIHHLSAMESFGKELAILDRGYPSFGLIETFMDSGVHYLFRVPKSFILDIDDMPLGDHRYALTTKGRHIRIRVIKFVLSSGETETLITDLFDNRIGTDEFKALYFKRWSVETKYGELKHKLEIENFSGRTKDTVYQDYYVTAYLSNMIAIAANETQPVIDKIRADRENIYDYKVNKSHAVGVFKDRFIRALIEPNPFKRDRTVRRILLLLAFHPTPKRSDRSVPRNPCPRNASFHFNQKSNC